MGLGGLLTAILHGQGVAHRAHQRENPATALVQPCAAVHAAAAAPAWVQLNVVNANTAKRFYVDLLGCRLNPVGTQRHQVDLSHAYMLHADGVGYLSHST